MAARSNTRMTAIVCHGPEDYRVERVERPTPGPRELVIRVGACGICASDCKCWQGAKMFWGGADPYVKPPVIPGHEFFGYVDELGEGAAERFGVKPGEAVIAEQIVPCDRCRYCRSGAYWMCEVHNIFGFQRQVADGGMAEYMLLPRTARVHVIPPEIAFEDAAIIEPLSCAIHTVQRGDIQLHPGPRVEQAQRELGGDGEARRGQPASAVGRQRQFQQRAAERGHVHRGARRRRPPHAAAAPAE